MTNRCLRISYVGFLDFEHSNVKVLPVLRVCLYGELRAEVN